MTEIVPIEKTWDYDDDSSRTVVFAFELDEAQGRWRVRKQGFVRGSVQSTYYFPETKEQLENLLADLRKEVLGG